MEKLYRRGRLRTLWDTVVISLWFVPVLMMLAGAALAAAGLALDLWFSANRPNGAPWWVYVGSAEDAREVLSTLLSSMITMTSLVFSVTIVVLTLAANQFGPRLIRIFMASHQTQLVLGTFVMVILYCLLVLPTVGWRASEGMLAFSTLSIAIVLAVISIGLLVLFIHHLARSIVSETIIERVGRELDHALLELDPLPLEAEREPDPERALPPNFVKGSAFFGPSTAGYVQAIEFERLVTLAQEFETVLGLFFRAGDYVAANGRGIAVYPRERFGSQLADGINSAITIGPSRTPVQDTEFEIRHLVEIGVRALSPSLNDPFTAVASIHRLSASLSNLMGRNLPRAVFKDGGGAVRVVCPRPTYASLIGAAFDQLRQNGANKPVVVIHLLEALTRIADHANMPEQVEALQNELRIILAAADRSIADPFDQADVKRRAEGTRKALERACLRVGAGRSN